MRQEFRWWQRQVMNQRHLIARMYGRLLARGVVARRSPGVEPWSYDPMREEARFRLADGTRELAIRVGPVGFVMNGLGVWARIGADLVEQSANGGEK